MTAPTALTIGSSRKRVRRRTPIHRLSCESPSINRITSSTVVSPPFKPITCTPIGSPQLPLSVSAAIGFIALFGQAVLNGVIMVSSLNHARDSKLPIGLAVIQGAHERLRPVLMTATVATLGLLPAALASGIGSDVQRPLATVVVGGLVSATILTLVVLPALYLVIERRFQPRAAAFAADEGAAS